MPNFTVLIVTKPRPWPFSWGPFNRGYKTQIIRCNAFTARVFHAGNTEPVLVQGYAGPDELTTTVDFHGSSRLKRRTPRMQHG